LLALAALIMGCASEGSTPPLEQDQAELVSAGVVRIHWTHTGAAADLNIRRMTGLEAVPIPEPKCSLDIGGSHPLYFDANWRAVKEGTRVPKTTISIAASPDRPVSVVEPDGQCRRVTDYDLEEVPAGVQRVLQLVASGGPSGSSPLQLTLKVDDRSVVVPLVPVCGSTGQPPSLTCTVDPVGYVSGAPFSADLQL
jgi:hypothetical protein